MQSTQFSLPGFSDPKALKKFNFGAAYAYSRSYNPRNIELRWYGMWDVALNALASDHSRLIVIPQHILYYIKSKNDETESVSNVEEPEPSDDPLDIIGTVDEEFDAAVGDTSLSTVVSGNETIAMAHAPFVIPDFAIIRLRTRRRSPLGGAGWRNVKIKRAGTPILVELKRSPSRSTPETRLGAAAKDMIYVAQHAVLRQAGYLFHMDPNQTSVVVIAGSGIYWTCKVAYPEDTLDFAGMMEEEDTDDEFMPPDGPESDGSGDEMEGVEDQSDDEVDDLDIMSLSVEPEGQEDLFEPVKDEEDLSLPTTEFTDILTLGTAASNQHMWLIHRRLQHVLNDHTGAMG